MLVCREKAIAKNATIMKNCMYFEFEQRELTDVIATLLTNFFEFIYNEEEGLRIHTSIITNICLEKMRLLNTEARKKKTRMKLQLPVG